MNKLNIGQKEVAFLNYEWISNVHLIYNIEFNIQT